MALCTVDLVVVVVSCYISLVRAFLCESTNSKKRRMSAYVYAIALGKVGTFYYFKCIEF